MPTAFESAVLNLKLFDLRREPLLREARAWFIRDFDPQTLEQLGAVVSSDRNASFRMVLGYWDMAASLVTQGAIPAEMFNAANTEHFALYAKLRPFLGEVRVATKYPDYLAHIERLVTSPPDGGARIDVFDRYMQRQRALAAEGKQRANYPVA